ncbi:hypothetical protein J6V85_00205 [Candidatus Saccharibacteria bacterium]|nr:hypothetical protein [Candidatus Saccharibacteria bacterium]
MFQEIVQLIQGVGFPIAACVFLFIEFKKLTQILADLTSALQVMNTRLDCIEDTLHIKKKEDEA